MFGNLFCTLYEIFAKKRKAILNIHNVNAFYENYPENIVVLLYSFTLYKLFNVQMDHLDSPGSALSQNTIVL